jgi:hypothetical protein
VAARRVSRPALDGAEPHLGSDRGVDGGDRGDRERRTAAPDAGAECRRVAGAARAAIPRAAFPLRVGDSWTYESETLFKDNGNSTARSKISVRVVSVEKVAVVAGEFDAFKLEARGRFRGLSRGGPGVLEGEFTSTYWYAPSVRTIVKSTLSNPYRGPTHVELVAASLKP